MMLAALTLSAALAGDIDCTPQPRHVVPRLAHAHKVKPHAKRKAQHARKVGKRKAKRIVPAAQSCHVPVGPGALALDLPLDAPGYDALANDAIAPPPPESPAEPTPATECCECPAAWAPGLPGGYAAVEPPNAPPVHVPEPGALGLLAAGLALLRRARQ